MSAELAIRELLSRLETANHTAVATSKAYLEAHNIYEEKGEPLEALLDASVKPYVDPANDRDPLIQDAARNAAAAARPFLDIRRGYIREISMLSLQLQVTGTGLIVAAQRDAMAAFAPIDPQRAQSDTAHTIREVKSLMERLGKVRTRQAVIVARAIASCQFASHAHRLATASLQIRQGMLEQYLEQTLTIRVDEVIGSVEDALAAELRDEILQEVLRKGAEVIGAAAEVVFPWVRIGTILYDLQKDLRALKNKYKRGDVDEMLRFSRQITASNENAAATLGLISQLPEIVAQKIPD